jgi:hypothetical protein
MSISLLEKLEGKTEEIEIDYGGMKIVFRTLSQKEYDEITRQNPRTDIFGLDLNKIPILARAIVSIDGQKFEGFSEIEEQDKNIPDIRKKENVIGNMDAIVVDELFRLYADEREKVLKKKTKMKESTQSSTNQI